MPKFIVETMHGGRIIGYSKEYKSKSAATQSFKRWLDKPFRRNSGYTCRVLVWSEESVDWVPA